MNSFSSRRISCQDLARVVFVLAIGLILRPVSLIGGEAVFKWVRTATSPRYNWGGTAVTVDRDGSIRVEGNFTARYLDFGTHRLTNRTEGTANPFSATYSATGELLSAWNVAVTGDTDFHSLTRDGAGDSYMTGYFHNRAEFGSTVLQTDQVLVCFVAKRNAAGDFLWAVQDEGDTVGQQVEAASNGEVWVSGLKSTYRRWILSKYSPSGTRVWQREASEDAWILGFALLDDKSAMAIIRREVPFNGGAIYYFLEATIFSPEGKVRSTKRLRSTGPPFQSGTVQAVSFDADKNFLIRGTRVLYKFDSEGEPLWFKDNSSLRWPAVNIASESNVAAISPSGYVYVCSPSSVPTGAPLWVQIFKPDGEELLWKTIPSNLGAIGLTVDDYGTAYITGWTRGSADFDSIRVTAQSDWDFYLARLDVANSRPEFQANRNQYAVNVLSNLVFTNTAFSTHALTYFLPSNAPAGMSIDQKHGIVRWAPPREFGGTSQTIAIMAQDKNIPPVVSTQMVTITVPHVLTLDIVKAPIKGGTLGEAAVSIFSSASLTNLSFTVGIPQDVASNLLSATIAGPQGRGEITRLSPTRYRVSFVPGVGTGLKGVLSARLQFDAIFPPKSSFRQLRISDVSGARSEGGSVEDIRITGGLIVHLGVEPVIELSAHSQNELQITLYGDPGVTYSISSTSSLGSGLWTVEKTLQLSEFTSSINMPIRSGNRFFVSERK